jgi:hypothetical protein
MFCNEDEYNYYKDETVVSNVQRNTYMQNNMDFYQTRKTGSALVDDDYRYLYIKLDDATVLNHFLEYSTGLTAFSVDGLEISNVQIRQFGGHAIVAP